MTTQRFKTVPDIIDAKINLVAFKNFATPVVVDEDFDIVQKPLTNGTIERVYRSKTPNSGLSGATIYSIRATLKSGLDPLTQ